MTDQPMLDAEKLGLTPEQEATLRVLDTIPISSWTWPRILLGIPLERTLGHADKCFWNFMMIASQSPAMIPMAYMRTDLYRNLLATKLLETNFTHVLMLDADHQHPIDIVQRLARWVLIDPKVKVVGGLNFRRGEPFEPCAFMQDNSGGVYSIMEWEKGLVQVDAIGTGSVLISREVFELLEPPWFYNIYDFAYEGHYPGEDIGFSKKCFDAGIPLYVDTTTSSPHLMDSFVTEESFRSYLKEYGWQKGEIIYAEEMRKRGIKGAAQPRESEKTE
jgi:hypothetical protein